MEAENEDEWQEVLCTSYTPSRGRDPGPASAAHLSRLKRRLRIRTDVARSVGKNTDYKDLQLWSRCRYWKLHKPQQLLVCHTFSKTSAEEDGDEPSNLEPIRSVVSLDLGSTRLPSLSTRSKEPSDTLRVFDPRAAQSTAAAAGAQHTQEGRENVSSVCRRYLFVLLFRQTDPSLAPEPDAVSSCRVVVGFRCYDIVLHTSVDFAMSDVPETDEEIELIAASGKFVYWMDTKGRLNFYDVVEQKNRVIKTKTKLTDFTNFSSYYLDSLNLVISAEEYPDLYKHKYWILSRKDGKLKKEMTFSSPTKSCCITRLTREGLMCYLNSAQPYPKRPDNRNQLQLLHEATFATLDSYWYESTVNTYTCDSVHDDRWGALFDRLSGVVLCVLPACTPPSALRLLAVQGGRFHDLGVVPMGWVDPFGRVQVFSVTNRIGQVVLSAVVVRELEESPEFLPDWADRIGGHCGFCLIRLCID